RRHRRREATAEGQERTLQAEVATARRGPGGRLDATAPRPRTASPPGHCEGDPLTWRARPSCKTQGLTLWSESTLYSHAAPHALAPSPPARQRAVLRCSPGKVVWPWTGSTSS